MPSGVLIKDEFSSVPSKQRRYQLRRTAKGLCERCGNPALPEMRHCKPCAMYNRRIARKRTGATHKYEDTKFTRALETLTGDNVPAR